MSILVSVSVLGHCVVQITNTRDTGDEINNFME